MSIVVDASVAAAWVLPDEKFPQADLLADSVEEQGALAPAIWQMEVLNTLLSAARRNRIEASRIGEYAGILDGWSTVLQPPLTPLQRERVIELSQKHRLTAYDASYLELAMRNASPLATLDADLRVAAQKEQVILLLG